MYCFTWIAGMFLAYLNFFFCRGLPCIFMICQIFFLASLDAWLACYRLFCVFTFLFLRFCLDLAVAPLPLLFLVFFLRASALDFFLYLKVFFDL